MRLVRDINLRPRKFDFQEVPGAVRRTQSPWFERSGYGQIKNVIVSKKIIELNESNFDQEVLDASRPVLVEFWAGWSEASKATDLLLETVAKDDGVGVKFVRVNVEHHENLTDQYGVRSVPTLLLFNQGTVQDQIVGRTTEQAVRAKLEHLR